MHAWGAAFTESEMWSNTINVTFNELVTQLRTKQWDYIVWKQILECVKIAKKKKKYSQREIFLSESVQFFVISFLLFPNIEMR